MDGHSAQHLDQSDFADDPFCCRSETLGMQGVETHYRCPFCLFNPDLPTGERTKEKRIWAQYPVSSGADEADLPPLHRACMWARIFALLARLHARMPMSALLVP